MPKEKQPLSKKKMDNPENSMTDKEHMLDKFEDEQHVDTCLLYTSPSPRD